MDSKSNTAPPTPRTTFTPLFSKLGQPARELFHEKFYKSSHIDVRSTTKNGVTFQTGFREPYSGMVKFGYATPRWSSRALLQSSDRFTAVMARLMLKHDQTRCEGLDVCCKDASLAATHLRVFTQGDNLSADIGTNMDVTSTVSASVAMPAGDRFVNGVVFNSNPNGNTFGVDVGTQFEADDFSLVAKTKENLRHAQLACVHAINDTVKVGAEVEFKNIWSPLTRDTVIWNAVAVQPPKGEALFKLKVSNKGEFGVSAEFEESNAFRFGGSFSHTSRGDFGGVAVRFGELIDD